MKFMIIFITFFNIFYLNIYLIIFLETQKCKL
jgi:hypothetical protein